MITPKRLLRGFAGIVGAIVLGAIGSGLWERCFSKLLDLIVNATVNVMSALSGAYKSAIYIEAAKGFHEYSSLFLHSIFLTMLPLAYLFLLWRHPYKKKEKEKDHIKDFIRSRAGFYTLAVLTFAVLITFLLDLTRVSYVNRVATFAHQSLAVIAPCTSDDTIKKLRADYHSMQNAEDFATFRRNIGIIAKKNKVKLPEFSEL
jgi:hypothetical protein